MVPPMGNLTTICADPVRLCSLIQRFNAGVMKGRRDQCWPWKGCTNAAGYGRMSAGRKTQLKAHRVAWVIAHGQIPESICVLHRCDTPACCNPAHLFLGTKKDNTKDMLQKKRGSAPPHSYGEDHHNTKFDASTAARIASDMRPARMVAAEHGISTKTVYRLRHGTTWTKLTRRRASEQNLFLSRQPYIVT